MGGRRFLAGFGAGLDAPVRFTDAAGDGIVISANLFRDAGGKWKVGKRGRARLVPLLAETIRDPDEIWLSVADKPDGAHIDRRYIRFDPATGTLVIFEWNWRAWAWEGVTAHAPQRKGRKMRTDIQQIERRRQGVLLYRRMK